MPGRAATNVWSYVRAFRIIQVRLNQSKTGGEPSFPPKRFLDATVGYCSINQIEKSSALFLTDIVCLVPGKATTSVWTYTWAFWIIQVRLKLSKTDGEPSFSPSSRGYVPDAQLQNCTNTQMRPPPTPTVHKNAPRLFLSLPVFWGCMKRSPPWYFPVAVPLGPGIHKTRKKRVPLLLQYNLDWKMWSALFLAGKVCSMPGRAATNVWSYVRAFRIIQVRLNQSKTGGEPSFPPKRFLDATVGYCSINQIEKSSALFLTDIVCLVPGKATTSVWTYTWAFWIIQVRLKLSKTDGEPSFSPSSRGYVPDAQLQNCTNTQMRPPPTPTVHKNAPRVFLSLPVFWGCMKRSPPWYFPVAVPLGPGIQKTSATVTTV